MTLVASVLTTVPVVLSKVTNPTLVLLLSFATVTETGGVDVLDPYVPSPL